MNEKRMKSYRTWSLLMTTACFLIFFLCSPGYGKDTVNLELIGRWGYRGAIRCLETLKHNNHRYAYFGTNNGLLILDVTDPNHLEEEVFLNIGEVNNIGCFTSENIILALGINELSILDITDPTRPLILTSYKHNSIGLAQGIAMSNKYAYVAAGRNGLVILDIQTPIMPLYVGQIGTQGYAVDVIIHNNYAYVADGDNGLVVIDTNNPNEPNYVGSCTYEVIEYAQSIAVYNNHAYMADGHNGLMVIDIGKPDDPEVSRQLYSDINVRRVSIINNTLYMGYSDPSRNMNGIKIIDVMDPNMPVIGKYEIEVSGLIDMSVSDEYVYITNANGLEMIDVMDPNRPFKAGEYKMPEQGITGAFEPTGAIDLTICDDYAYIADWFNGLVIIDITDTNRPLYTGGIETSGEASGLVISNEYAYLADGSNGLVIIDVSDPIRPAEVGKYDKENWKVDHFWNLAIDTNRPYAYVANSQNGLMIIDISNPEYPHLTRYADTSGEAFSVAYKENFAYVADGSKGLVIIDVSDPEDPNIIWGDKPFHTGDYPSDCIPPICKKNAQDIFISGDLAYIADGYYGLVIIDITNPYKPSYKGGYRDLRDARKIAIQDNLAYLTATSVDWNYYKIAIIDITDPNNPEYAGEYKTQGMAWGIDIDEMYAYVANGENGLLCLKIIKSPPLEGNLILCASGPALGINPLWPPTQALANLTYAIFTDQNYPHYFTYYLTPNPYQDINGDGIPDSLAVDDYTPTWEDIKYTLTKWADSRINRGPLYLYFTGLGGQDIYQIFPGQILKASGPANTNSLKNYLDTFQFGTNRDLICLFEFASSGSFIDDLIDPTTEPYNRTIITCTDGGNSFLDPNGMLSFTGNFLKLLGNADQSILFADTNDIPPNISRKKRVCLLEEIFSNARENFWYKDDTYNYPRHPFNAQPPQMVTAMGPHTLCSITLIPEPNKLIITGEDQIIRLDAKGHFLDFDSAITDQVYYHSSDPSILQVNQAGEAYADPNTGFNGRAYILATIIDPNFARCPGQVPDSSLGGVTGRIQFTVDIPGQPEKADIPLAIIVAGEKQRRDYLWSEIQTISKYAYLNLLSRGYSRKSIKFFTHLKEELLLDTNPNNDNDTDLDGDGDPNNDIDGIPSIANLEQAFNWVKEKVPKNLLIFLADHGVKTGGFSLNQHEILTPEQLNQWLEDDLFNGIDSITIIIESCHSGLFIKELSDKTNKNRVIITSTGEGNSYIYAHGIVSFSYYLFTYLQIGVNMATAYDSALLSTQEIDRFLYQNRENLNEPRQIPKLYNRPLANTISLGDTVLISQDQPVISTVEIFPNPNVTVNQEITIKAKAFDLDGIEKVWAVINDTYSPPVFSGDPARALIDLPMIELAPIGENQFIKTYPGFAFKGHYSLLVFAQDTKGNVSLPFHYSIEVKGYTQNQAILVASWDPDDSHRFHDLLSYAEWVLEQKGFDQSQILRIERPTLEDISDALKDIPQNTHQLFIYLVGQTIYDNNANGPGQSECDANQHVVFCLNPGDPNDILDPDTLNGLLADANCASQVVLIDSPGAKDFFRPSSKDQIYIWSSSCGEPAYMGQEGRCAFSHFFFTCVYWGESIYQAFVSSREAVQYYSYQNPGLEDGQSGQLAHNTYLGNPFIVPREFPQIIVPHDQPVQGETSLWARVKDPDPNTRVWALVRAPGKGPGETQKIEFDWNSQEGLYKKSYNFTKPGVYEVKTYVQTPSGLVNFDQTNYLTLIEDPYEKDNTSHQATPILINDTLDKSQIHNFHTANDDDWLVFYGYPYDITPFSLYISRHWDSWGDHNCPLAASIHYLDGNQVYDICTNKPIQFEYTLYDPVGTTPESTSFCLPETGFYFIRLTYGCEEMPPNTPAYYTIVKLTDGLEVAVGNVIGFVLHDTYKFWQLDAWVYSIQEGSGQTEIKPSDKTNGFGFDLEEGYYRLYAEAEGYHRSDETHIHVSGTSKHRIDLFLNPLTPEDHCIFSAAITATGQVITDADNLSTVYIGMDTNAITKPSPGPPTGYTVYMTIFDGLIEDYRQIESDYEEWKLIVLVGDSADPNQSNFFPVLGWDPNEFCFQDSNSVYMELYAEDDQGERILLVKDMYQTTQYLTKEEDGQCDLDTCSFNYYIVWSKEISHEMNLPKGWSMMSLPVKPANARVSALFTDAEVVYGYEKDRGYVRVPDNQKLEVGKGYWIKFDEHKNYVLTGQPIYSYTNTVYEDAWRMIGGCSSAAMSSTDDCKIWVIYKYVQGSGYQLVPESESLEPGNGFWILLKDVSDQCQFTVKAIGF